MQNNREDTNTINPFHLLRFIITILLLFCFLFIIMSRITLDPSDFCYNKEDIRNRIKLVIKNGGQLNQVKHIYNTRKAKWTFVKLHLNPPSRDDYYKEDYPLSSILRDIEIECLEQNDSLLLPALSTIIINNEWIDPFDKLEINQKYNFENIQQKLDSNYVIISSDISKIVDELYNKNQLVTKYLNDSKTSLRISWIALIVTILLSFYQIYQNRKSSIKHNKRFDEIEKMIKNKE